MTKKLAAGVGISILLITLYGMSGSHPELRLFINLNQQASILRILIAVILITYSMVGILRNIISKQLVILSGLALCLIALNGLIFDNLFGKYSYYLMPIDFFISIEASILLILSGIELPTRQINLRNTVIYSYLRYYFSLLDFKRFRSIKST